MTIRLGRRFRGDVTGTTALEFAFAGPALLGIILGIIELGIVGWSWQALQATATDAARCAALSATSCKNASLTQTYASTAASSRGLSLPVGNVTVATGTAAQTACGTNATVVSVALSYQIAPGFLSWLPSNVTASACFPVASS
jgi:Flp pilus assembly protein TadG